MTTNNLKLTKAVQELTTDNQENPIKSVVNSVDERFKSLNGILGTAVSAVDGTFNSREIFNKLKGDVAKKYGLDSAMSTINETMGLVKSFELAVRGVPNDGSPKANYSQISNVANHQYPSDLGGMYMQISLKEWKKLSAFGKNSFDTKTSIALPIPKNLVEQHNVDYKPASLGSLIGGFKQGALGAANNQLTGDFERRLSVSMQSVLTEAVIRGVEGGINKAANFIPIFGDAVASLNTTGANAVTEIKNNLDDATEQSLGLAYNPNLTLILGGPRLRTHQFSWFLAAKNYEESKAIKEIINELRKAMLPSSVDGFIYKYPNYALIRIHPENDFLYKFKPCVISGLSVNYAGAGYPSFMPGKDAGNHPPTIIELTIAFQEVETIIRENIESGDEFLSNATVDGSTVTEFDSFITSITKATTFGVSSIGSIATDAVTKNIKKYGNFLNEESTKISNTLKDTEGGG
jgi:hypothetical protein